MDFGHVLTAMVTPFDTHGEIDFIQMSVLIEHLLENGTEGLLITGTTGESAVLSFEEKKKIYNHVVQVVGNRVPVLAGIGTNNTMQSIETLKAVHHLGLDGIMIVAPYYNRPNQRGLYEHFKLIAAETVLPVMLYNIPSRCGVHIEAETIIELSKIDNIVALKEASGNLEHTARVISNTANDFHVYSGDDSMTLPMMTIGAIGVVSVASHIIGNSLKEMVESFLMGNTKKATEIHLESLPIMKGVFMAPSPAPIKAALQMYGIDTGSVRLPLVDLTLAERNQLQNIILKTPV